MGKIAWVGLFVALLFFTGPTRAQDEGAAAEWQAVITGQIQAFRDHDAPRALSFAAAPFHQSFADPEDFFAAIIGSGYAPIMESRAHSFGAFTLAGEGQVLQDVKFTGKDNTSYEAIYQLDREEGGWRVHGVQLTKVPGIGV